MWDSKRKKNGERGQDMIEDINEGRGSYSPSWNMK
jgi:hypothetical protein